MTKTGIKAIAIAVVASVLLSACNQPQPSPTSTTGATTAPGTTSAAPANTTAPGDTAVPPPTAGPTPTPRPLGNPILVDHEPVRGEELQLDKPIVLTFDQPMDRASVEQAVKIEPGINGTFDWTRDNVVTFKPSQGWDRAKSYSINLKDAAKSAKGLALARAEAFNVSTIGYLDVAQTIPANGSQGVSADTRITVLFNRPVVPLTGIDQQANLPNPVVFEPPIEGKGEWLNTSIYLLRPTKPLAAGVVYKGVVPAGLKDTTGAILEKQYSWSFSVAAPIVKNISPPNGYADVDLRQPISVTFSQLMDHSSAEAAFKLTPAVRGTFRWANEEAQTQDRPYGEQIAVGTPPQAPATGEVMGFWPDEDYQRGTQYRVDMAAGAQAVGGASATERSSRFGFSSIMLPDVQTTAPENGASKADATNGFVIRFTAPVLPDTIIPNLRFQPQISLTKVYTYYDAGEKRFYLNLPLLPSTRYQVTIGGNISDKYGVTIGKDTLVQFTTAPFMPFAVLNTNGSMGTYNSSKPTRLFASYRNVSRLDLELASVTPQQFYTFTGADDAYNALRNFKTGADTLVRRWSLPVSSRLNEFSYQSVDLAGNGGALTPGIYLLTMSAPEALATVKYYEPARHILIVTNMQVTLKQGERESLAWVTDLNSGQPLAGMPVTMYDKGFAQVHEATTDPDGMALAKFDISFEEYQPFYAFVGTPGTSSFGVAFNRWDQGINAYDFNLQSQFGSTQKMAYLYTDRPIYRPGQMVYLKGIVRAEDDARYQLATDVTNVDMQVSNDQGQQVFSVTLPVNANGTFNGSFALDSGAASGSYYAQICLPFQPYAVGSKGGPGVYSPAAGNDTTCRGYGVSFQVSTYRRPEFEVSVATDKADYLAGDTFKATATAKYYFGGNVSNAKVQWTLFAREYYFDKYTGDGYYSFGDYDYFYRGVSYNQQIANGEGTTDANGQLVISVPADLSKQKNSATFSLEMSVTDLNDQSVSSRAEAVVHKSDYYLGIAPEIYVGQMNQEAMFNVIAVDWQGQPLADKSATVSFYQREWFTTQVEDQFGNREFTSVPSDTLVSTAAVKTDASGKAVTSFTPAAGGEYHVVVKGATEPAPLAATSFYVSSGGEYVLWRVNNNDRIDLKTDKQDYKVGEVVKVLVPSPYSGTVNALLTVERGRFLLTRLVQLKSNSDILEIPVEASFAPNAFVSVLIVKGVDASNPVAEYKIGYVGFKVDPGQFALNVEIKPDKTTYGPRDTVTYDIRVTDADGNPAQAELSLALVDKAVLSLADPNSAKIFDAFYGVRGLGFHTASSLNINVDRVTAKIVADNAKGGGGGGMSAALDGLFVRQNFKDTAYWSAEINTDAQGKARVNVTLPDNLTTWKLDARAITADSKAGQGVNEILSTKPLLIRPVTPRFFVVGDSVTLGAVVNNNTDSDIQAEVSLDAKGVSIGSSAAQQVTVKAKGSARVDWQVTVQDAPSAELTFNVKGGGLQDSSMPGLATAPNQGIPILRYASPETVATAGDVSEAGKKQELIALPPRLDTGKGQLDIEVNPALASVIKTGDDALREYPYDSAETTASRILVSLAVDNNLTRETVGRGVQRLLGSQHSDGGWGWWVTDESSRAITAYVVLALAGARDAGYAVDTNSLTRAQEWLTNQLVAVDKQPDLGNQQAFILYALATAGADDSGRLGALYEMRAVLNYASKAMLAMSLEKVNPGDTRVKSLLSDITSGAVAGPAGMMWQEKELNFYFFDSNTRSTAIVLKALAKLDPKSALSTNVVRWLMVAREGDTWETNQEIAWAVMALAEWSKAVGEKDANYSWRVTLNDTSVLNGEANAANLTESSKLTIAVSDLLKTQANTLVFERGAGTGRLYYTARLKVFLPADEVKALNRGIVIARKYELADCKPEPGKPCAAINSASIGQNVRVRLTIVAPTDLYFVNVNDPLPGGAEAVDTSLKTSQQVGTQTEVQEIGGWGGWGWWWFSHTELRDDHAALFASYLPEGTYEYTYVIRPSIAGAFKVLPASVNETYFPETFGRSDGAQFTIGK